MRQKPKIIKLALPTIATALILLGHDNFLTVSSFDFAKSIKVVQKPDSSIFDILVS